MESGLSAHAQTVAIIASAGLLLVILELVRRRRLVERYALLWLLAAVVLLVFSIWEDLLFEFSELIGIETPSNALFVVAFGFVLLLLLHFSSVSSRLSEENKVLAQELARLDQELHAERGERPGLTAAARRGPDEGD
jgi:hypothetical protein